MAVEKVIVVPTIFQGPRGENQFRRQLVAALEQECLVALDFQSHPAVSSVVLGQILFHIRDISDRVQFINVSNYMFDTLRTITGPLAGKLVRRPIRNLDDSDVLDEV